MSRYVDLENEKHIQFEDVSVNPDSIVYRIFCSECLEDITSYYQNENEEKHQCKKHK